MDIVLLVILVIVVALWFGGRAQRRQFHAKKNNYKRPVWNVLNRQPEPYLCLEINRQLRKIRSLPEISDFELYFILAEMVGEGTLVESKHERIINGKPIRVTKYSVAPGSDPPQPPREDPEEENGKELTPIHT